MRELLVVLMLCGCAGAAEDEPLAEESDATPPVEEMRPETPLCEGSPPASPALCQSLRYGDHGYCNFWRECP